jgi:hypothetical protein
MALRFLHSINVPRRTIGADGVQTYDLAVNPLSVILINIRPLNDTGTLANFVDIVEMAKAMNSVQVLYRGEAIKSFATGADLVAFNWFRWGMIPWDANPSVTDNERRHVAIPLMMGRNPYDPKSCFPATRRGELQLVIDWDIADTGYDNLDVSIDTIELFDAKPSEFEKNVSQSLTFSATGDNDIDLPIGNVFRNIMAFGTTGFTGASPAASLGRMKVLIGNKETHYTAIDFEVANMMSALWGRQGPVIDHQHRTTVDGNAGTSVTTLGRVEEIGSRFGNYAWLDFDPTKDDTYSLDTSDANRFHLRCNAGTADLVRVIPTEVVSTAGVGS